MRRLVLALLGTAWLLPACDRAQEPAPQALLTVDVVKIAYPVPCCSPPKLSAVFGFRFQDDKGNALNQDIRLAIG
jgi:hypothetical protein